MRVLTSNSIGDDASNKPGGPRCIVKDNLFEPFTYKEESFNIAYVGAEPSATAAAAAAIEVPRQPGLEFITEVSRLPRRRTVVSHKRRILDDSDEEDDANMSIDPSTSKSSQSRRLPRQIQLSPDRGEWLESMHPIKKAQTAVVNSASATPLAEYLGADISDTPDLTVGGTSMKSSRSCNINAASLNGDNNRNGEAVMIGKEPGAQDADSSAHSIVEEDADSDGGTEEWNASLSEDGVQKQAASTLRLCKQLSTNLQASLREWKGDNSDNRSKAVSNTNHNCVDLVRITKGVDLLTAEDVAGFAADGVTLKNYQLVGVNWLKLLHHNNVNGVLADDMGLGKTIQTIIFLGWLRFKSRSSSSSSNSSGSVKKRRAHLIVVPASTLSNWQIEFAKFCPRLAVVTYHGSHNERQELRYSLRKDLDQGAVDVVLCTYTLFERESNKIDRTFLGNQHFDFLVLDEAHCIKNSASSRFEHLNRLHTKHRLLLSGTPVQNDLSELLSLLSFLMKDVFPSHQIGILLEAFGWEKGSKDKAGCISSKSLSQLRSMLAPFVLRRLKHDVLDQLTDKIFNVKKLEMTAYQETVYNNILLAHAQRKELYRIQKIKDISALQALDCVKPGKSKKVIILKESLDTTVEVDVASIPPPSTFSPDAGSCEVIDLVSPEPGLVQKKSTAGASPLERGEGEEEEAGVAKMPCDDCVLNVAALEKAVQDMSTSEANSLFTALRKAANHPLLLRVHYKDEDVMNKIAVVAFSAGHFGVQCDLERVKGEIETFSDFDIHQLCLMYPSALGQFQLNSHTLYESPKMQTLKLMLPMLQAEGHRMLIFSQWTRILDLLEVLLQDIDINYLRLDGSTPVKERQYLIDKYSLSTDIPVFLLSTKAGGLGINLTAADTVILHDLDFNPENDRQAEDRAHRLGQARDVTVYRLVTANSVDESIFEMGERKRELSQRVLCDHRFSGAGGMSSKRPLEEDDATAISRILQKALSKVLVTTPGKSPESVMAIDGVL